MKAKESLIFLALMIGCAFLKKFSEELMKSKMRKSSAAWKPGWRTIGGKKCYFRSRWEANYALYLEFLKTQKQIIEWEYEPKTFWFEGVKRGTVSYLPDFRITNNNESQEYHEVKGWMDPRSKTKLKRMAKYYPEEKLILIQEKQYNEIKRKVGPMLVGWER